MPIRNDDRPVQRVASDLYISGIAAVENTECLTSRGITAVLKLTHSEPSEPYPESVTVTSQPLIDGPQNDLENFEAAVDALVSLRQAGETVLVHCSAGSSRSGAVVAAALAKQNDTTIETTLDQLQERKPDIEPHPALLEHARRTVT